MKKLALLLISFAPFILYGQAVDHFDNETSEWYVAYVHPNPDSLHPGFVETRSTFFTFWGDTTINGENWLKLYSAWDTSLSLNLHFKGHIHSSNGIVRLQKQNYEIDTLYNFNLQVGDSVFYNLFFDPQYIPIIEIDSIFLNGSYFKRYFFDEPTGPIAFDILNEVWIEGIGSIHGPLFPIEPRKFATEWPDELDLTCSFTNGFQYYANSSYEECFINTILYTNEIQKNYFSIYPNPFSDEIFIASDLKHDIIGIEIYNLQGMKMLTNQVPKMNQKINLEYLPVGIYLLKIIAKDYYVTQRILKLY